MGLVQSEISIIMGTLSSVYTLINDPSTGIVLKPHTTSPTWTTIVPNMHRLLVLRSLINEGDRFPEDPWALFLREFGVSDSDCFRNEEEVLPDSILLTSPRYRREGYRLPQTADSRRHVRFQLPGSRQAREVLVVNVL